MLKIRLQVSNTPNPSIMHHGAEPADFPETALKVHRLHVRTLFLNQKANLVAMFLILLFSY